MPHKYSRNRIGLLVALALVLLTACSSQDAIVSGGRSRPDVTLMIRGQGKDICDQFPEIVTEFTEPGSNSPLHVIPGDHVRGADNAEVTILVYNDLQCANCAKLDKALQVLLERHPDSFRIAYRHYPMIGVSDKAKLAAEATEAADSQGGNEAFWAMHDLLIERQSEWTDLSEVDFRKRISEYATELGLDGQQIFDELTAGEHEAQIRFSLQAASELNIQRAPTIYINGVPLSSPPIDAGALDLTIEILRLQVVYATKPPLVIDPEKEYVAWIVTEHGDIALNLFADLAPETVNNFAYLACVGFYDDITWHRVIPGFMAQTGDPTGTGFGGPGYTIRDEYMLSKLSFNKAGLLSMAHTDQPNSAGSQFFITYGPTPYLDGSFTIFGEVASGMDVLLKLTPRDPQADPAFFGDKLVTLIVREVIE